VQLTDTPEGVLNARPAWSPDGTRIAFISDRDGSPSIYVMAADGTNVQRRTFGPMDITPTWMPDGSSIVYSGQWAGSSAILRTAASGPPTPPTVIFDLPGWDADPAVSPDGQSVAFTSDQRAYDFLADLYVAPIGQPAEFQPLLLGPFFAVDGRELYLQAAWSPDGQRIAVTACNNPTHWCAGEGWIGLVRPGGAQIEHLVTTLGRGSPSWSPNSAWLAYTSRTCAGAIPCIQVISVDGGAWEEVLVDAKDPSWRP
jgi:Tol biopolymer transport system component